MAATSCPTFSWVPAPGAGAQELVVYPLSGKEGSGGTISQSAEPALWVRLPGGASSWSAPLGQCLELDRTYAWIVRSTDGDGEESWSEAARFRVVGPEALGEVEAAFERMLERVEDKRLAAGGGEAIDVPGARGPAAAEENASLAPKAGGGATVLGSGLLGNTGPNALELIVFGERALRLEPEVSSHSGAVVPNVVGGHTVNRAVSGVLGATVGGGGGEPDDLGITDTFVTEFPNIVADHFGTIAGGWGNKVGLDDGDPLLASFATVGGGNLNTASSESATIAGGRDNWARAAFATIGGGNSSLVIDDYGTVAGGADNLAGSVDNDNRYATVGGGNRNSAIGAYSTVPGGVDNYASGDHSLAAGRRAEATHVGTFVWADSTNADFTSTSADQFLVRAGGGVGIYTDSPDAPLDVGGGNNWDLAATEGDVKIGNDTYRLKMGVATGGGGAGVANIHAAGGLARINLGSEGTHIVQIDPNVGVYPGADDTYSLGKSGSKWTKVWATNGTIQTSDRRLKRGIADLDYGLAELLALRPVAFRWKDRSGSDRHLGFLAQEAERVVPEVVERGDDPEGLLGMDYAELVPVLVRAIQEQQRQIADQRKEIEALRLLVERVDRQGTPRRSRHREATPTGPIEP